MEVGNLIVRPFQLFFVAIILGLSISLVKEQVQYTVPSISNFAIACGAVGAATFIVGIAAVFFEKLQGVVMLALDGFSTLFTLAGSIALAVQLGVHSCTDRPAGYNKRAHDNGAKEDPPNPYCAKNPIIAGGATEWHPKQETDFTYLRPDDWFVSRCRRAQALDAFLFFAFFAFAVSLVLDLLSTRRKRVTAV